MDLCVCDWIPPASAVSSGLGSLCRRSRWGATSSSHHWSNLPLSLWIRPIQEQLEEGRGCFQEESGYCGWAFGRSVLVRFYFCKNYRIWRICHNLFFFCNLQGLSPTEKSLRWKLVFSSIWVSSVITWGSPNIAASSSDAAFSSLCKNKPNVGCVVVHPWWVVSDPFPFLLTFQRKSQLLEDLYRANFNLGNIYFRNGEHSNAVRCLEQAKECARKMKDKFIESECFHCIGKVLSPPLLPAAVALQVWVVHAANGCEQVQLSLGDFVAARRSLKKALQLGSQQPQDRMAVKKAFKYGKSFPSARSGRWKYFSLSQQKSVFLLSWPGL